MNSSGVQLILPPIEGDTPEWIHDFKWRPDNPSWTPSDKNAHDPLPGIPAPDSMSGDHSPVTTLFRIRYYWDTKDPKTCTFVFYESTHELNDSPSDDPAGQGDDSTFHRTSPHFSMVVLCELLRHYFHHGGLSSYLINSAMGCGMPFASRMLALDNERAQASARKFVSSLSDTKRPIECDAVFGDMHTLTHLCINKVNEKRVIVDIGFTW